MSHTGRRVFVFPWRRRRESASASCCCSYCANTSYDYAFSEEIVFDRPACEPRFDTEIGVIGVPHDSWGEQVHAVVVLRPATSLALAELQEFGQGQLASFKLPRSMSLAEELPRTPSGKIKKAELRAPYWRGRERSVH